MTGRRWFRISLPGSRFSPLAQSPCSCSQVLVTPVRRVPFSKMRTCRSWRGCCSLSWWRSKTEQNPSASERQPCSSWRVSISWRTPPGPSWGTTPQSWSHTMTITKKTYRRVDHDQKNKALLGVSVEVVVGGAILAEGFGHVAFSQHL